MPDGPREQRRIGHREAQGDPLEPLERHRVQPADGAEVEQPEGPAGVDENVAGVGVGVVEAVVQDLAEHRAEETIGELAPRDAAGVDRLRVGDGPAGDRLHHQDPIGRERGVDGGDLDAHVIRPVLAQACAGGRFVAVAQLVRDPVDQLAGEPLDAHALRRGNAPVELRGGEGEHGAVAADEVVHAGSLDLDHHRLASVQRRAVGLADGRGGQGLRLERLEGVVRRLAELGLDHRANLVDRDRAHVGLEV